MRTVFLSSVGRDLREFREAAFRAIEGLEGYHCCRMEDFGSWDIDPDEFCRAKVGQADVFVGLLGPLYGSVTPAGPSYTESEFGAAIEHHKRILVFLTADDFPLPSNLIEPDDLRKRQHEFRERASQGRIVVKFSEPDELAKYVIQAIRNMEAGQAASNATSPSRLRIRLDQAQSAPQEFSAAFIGIGRGPRNHIRIDEPDVSWEHGQILFQKGAYYYRQLSESSPSSIIRRGKDFVLEPGENAEIALQTQDRLQIGGSTFVVEFDLTDVDDDYTPTTKRRISREAKSEK